MKVGIVIGRFQPLHNGHLDLIDTSRKNNDKTIVFIGSTNRLPDFKNPFTVEERIKLVRACVSEGDDFKVIGLKDKPTDEEWCQDVMAFVMDFQEDPSKVTLYTSRKDKDWYERNLIYPVVPLSKHENLSATNVRTAWYEDELELFDGKIPQVTMDLLNGHLDVPRLRREYNTCHSEQTGKVLGHPYGNPMEPVSFAVIIQNGKILVGMRGGTRGNGQFGLPGGYVSNNETTLESCIREVKEEMGISLDTLITEGKAKCMMQTVEENMNDIGSRTLGINYLFVVNGRIDLDIKVDGEETLEYKWIPMMDILEERELLFYNHNLVAQRLVSSLTKGEQNE